MHTTPAASTTLLCCLLWAAGCGESTPPPDFPDTAEESCEQWRRAGCKKMIECLEPEEAKPEDIDACVASNFLVSCEQDVAESLCPAYALEGYFECRINLPDLSCDSMCFGRPNYAGCTLQPCVYTCG